MKKFLAVLLSLCTLLLCACALYIPDSDRQSATAVLPSDDNTRTPLRMFRIDGTLYYDTGLVSDMTPRCGTLDGSLKKTADAFSVPTEDGTCNFEGADGYQTATSITKEVPIENEGWCIFKKVDVDPSVFKTMPYCMQLVGRLPSAAIDSKLLILTESLDVTVWDIMSPLFSSKFPTEVKYKTYTLSDKTAPDKWGLTLTAENVTPTGLTLHFEQLGGTLEGHLQTGNPFTIEKQNEDGEWTPLTPKNAVVWTLPAFLIPENDIYEKDENWEYLYGALPPGSYRMGKEVADFKQGHEYKPETYYAYFDITEELCGYPPAKKAE